MKKFVLGFVLGALLFSIMPVSAAVQQYILTPTAAKIVLDGTEVTDPKLPIMNYQGYNYLPASVVKKICDKIKVGFAWENTKKEIQIDTKGATAVSDNNTFPYRNPLMVDSSTPPETIDGLSVYTYDGVQYVASSTKKDILGNDIVGFDSRYFPNYNKYLITYLGKTFSLTTRDPQVEILSIPAEKQYVLNINRVTCFEYSYYQNTIEPLIKPVDEPKE